MRVSNNLAGAASERLKAVHKLYFDNYGFIEGLASSDRAGTFAESGAIVSGIAQHLGSYPGDLTDAAFQAWARDVILPLLAFNEIHRTCSPYVKDAIWRVLGACADLGDVQDMMADAEQETWAWAAQNLETLCDATAKARPKTRLYAKARFAALTVRKKAIRARDRFGTGVDIRQIGTDADNPFYAPAIVIEAPRKAEFDPYERCETVRALNT